MDRHKAWRTDPSNPITQLTRGTEIQERVGRLFVLGLSELGKSGRQVEFRLHLFALGGFLSNGWCRDWCGSRGRCRTLVTRIRNRSRGSFQGCVCLEHVRWYVTVILLLDQQLTT